ncbi:MAG: hypothetical protein FWD24_09305 [Treponema sp.]|nr:hypothetical protein [Treponema sp.]
MKKKILLVLVLVALVSTGVFAQFALEGNLNFSGQNFTQSIGITYALPEFDILAGLNFGFYSVKVKVAGISSSDSDAFFGLYGGIAPRVVESDNWTLSLPMLANLSSYLDVFAFGLTAGARMEYSLSQNWSIFGGLALNIFTWVGQEESQEIMGYIISYKIDATAIFDGGFIQFGVKYSF